MELNHCDKNTKQYNSGIYKAYRGRSSRVCQWGGNVIWGFRKEEGSRIVSRITSSRKERRTFHAEVISLHRYCSSGIYSPQSSQRVLFERQIPQCHFPLLQTKPTTTNKKSWRAPRPTCILPITPHSSEAILLLCCSMCSSYVLCFSAFHTSHCKVFTPAAIFGHPFTQLYHLWLSSSHQLLFSLKWCHLLDRPSLTSPSWLHSWSC